MILFIEIVSSMAIFIAGIAVGAWCTLEWSERDIQKQGWTTTRSSKRIVGKLETKIGDRWL